MAAAEAKVHQQTAEIRRLSKLANEGLKPELAFDEDGCVRPPIRLGDLMGPDGNIFMVIGNIKAQMKQVRESVEAKGRTYVVNPKALEVVEDFRSRSYTETLDLIERYFNDLDDRIAEFKYEMDRRENDW